MQIMRATVDWFIDNGGPSLAMAHLEEAMPVTAEKNEFREVDYAMYAELEMSGSLLVLVAIDDENNNEFVGYVVGTASPSIHNRGYFEFSTTAFYTVPHVREQGVARQLFEALQAVCRQSGVAEINYSVSEGQPMTHEVVKKLGLIKSETMYSMKVKHE
ncbi:GNAT family N-acetyltransferase [Halobacteriovorax sp. XZX-3]|uniref:GNAT family N-acetyltransferase n=2 Tax=unclassified Halobacteriovorax TaxID=2639665 RepID=UPI0037193889